MANSRGSRVGGLRLLFGASRKLGGSKQGLGRSTKKAARGRSMKARPTQSRKGVKGGLRPFLSAPCRVKGQRPLWGLGQRPNCSEGDQHLKRTQQRRRQRSVPASNFARPQTRPQTALPQDSVKNQNFASAGTDAFWQMCLRWSGKS